MKTQNEKFLGRFKTRDSMMTFDAASMQALAAHGIVASGYDNPGKPLMSNGGRNISFTTHDGKTVDSTGAFLVGELERLDQTLHKPLVSVSWQRDIDLRGDVTIADDYSSFTKSIFGAPGGLGAGQSIGNKKGWIAKNTTQIPGVSVDIAKIPQPLNLWAREIAFTIPELESAAKVGRPIDEQKLEGLRLDHQLAIDEMVYIGDTTVQVSSGQVATGLVNSPLVTPTNAATVSSATTWAAKIAAGLYDAVTADVNTLITNAWTASGWALIPGRVLLPPADYSLITEQKVSSAGNVSIMKYIQENNIYTRSTGRPLEVFPLKWLNGAGSGGTLGTGGAGHDRMIAYTKAYDRVRYPMTELQRTPLQYDSIWHKTSYFCKLGCIELVYPESVAYVDGIS
jgi:hypothetical protein